MCVYSSQSTPPNPLHTPHPPQSLSLRRVVRWDEIRQEVILHRRPSVRSYCSFRASDLSHMADKKADCSQTVAKPRLLWRSSFVGSRNSLMSWKDEPIRGADWLEKKCQRETTAMLHFKPDYHNQVRLHKSDTDAALLATVVTFFSQVAGFRSENRTWPRC